MDKKIFLIAIMVQSLFSSFAQEMVKKMVVKGVAGEETRFVVNSLEKVYFIEETSSQTPVVVGESNCYMVAPQSNQIKIPVSQANKGVAGAIGDQDVVEAELIWSDVKGSNNNAIAADGSIASIHIDGIGSAAYLCVTPGSGEGNAVIAAKVNGVIKWSWHIWVTYYNPNNNPFTLPSGVQSMGLNLGAQSSTRDAGLKGYGLLYQFGRKDPFPNTSNIQSKSEKVLYTSTGTTGCAIQAAPATSAGGNNLINSIKNPLTVYTNVKTGGKPEDWYVTQDGATPNNGLWSPTDGSKGIFDPCPEGWRLPSKADYSGIEWGNNMAWNAAFKGVDITYQAKSGWYPAAGSRNAAGNIGNPSFEGLYWFSTPIDAFGTCLYFHSAGGTIKDGIMNRTQAYPVRCVKEIR